MNIPKCDYCESNAVLKDGEFIYPHRPDLYYLCFWVCIPCNAWVGCHKNSDNKPLGRLAKKDLRRKKLMAHNCFDKLWKSYRMKRCEAYQWLADNLNINKNKCHMGLFDIDTCNKVIGLAISKWEEIK